jgi:type I restriction enzyme S subunit
MSDVPHLRFPEFSGEWYSYPLTDFMSFKNGMNPDAKRFGRGIKFISVMDILNNQFICYDNIRASVEVIEGDIETYGVNYGDILFQRSSETLEDVGQANVYLDRKPAVFGGFVIRGKSKGNYHPVFFRYLLASPTARKRIIVKGAGAQHFNIGQDGLSRVCLNIPSIQEQEKIAKLFECVDTRIATQNKIIEDLKKLKSAISERLFNAIKGDVVVLEDIGDVVKGKQINGEFLSESGKYYVMNGGIEPSGFYNDYNVEANTISISEGGNSCGYVQFNAYPFWSGGHCYTIQNTTDNVKTEYLYQFLKSKESEIMKLRIGSGLPNIQKKDLAKFKITIPNISEQKVISAFLSSFERKADVEMNFVNLLLEEKQYLLRQMFI